MAGSMVEEVPLSGFEKDLLMELQYRFPRSHRPFHVVAERLGASVDEVVEALAKLRREKKLKRIGYYVNYRSKGLKAALIAYRSEGKVGELAAIYQRDPYATHVYLRDHPVYDVWVVTKRPTMEELVAHARSVSEQLGIDYVILYSVRTYKLSVKYDLYKGISWAGEYSYVNPNPPSSLEYGVEPGKLNLFKSLELSANPYSRIAQSLGVSEEEAAALAWRLLEAGILGDPGAALDGHRVGFVENAMVVMEPAGVEERLCECVSNLPFATHVVQRASIPAGKWKHTCYFMVHAVNMRLMEEVISEAVERCGPKSYHAIRSIEDLKPGVVR